MNRITRAREDAGLSVKELAERLAVDIGTVRNWEAGRRQLTLERLIEIANLLGVSVTYLLGLDEQVSNTSPVEKAMLPVLHRIPVWTQSHGWALVNSVQQHMVYADGSTIPFERIKDPIYMTPPAMALSLLGVGSPLTVNGIASLDRVWVEFITTDFDLAAELRGWYRPRGQRLVENEFGNRFYFDSYGSKWLAFESCLIQQQGRFP
jgi:transcriptional regulator with XRE-family HTH domain